MLRLAELRDIEQFSDDTFQPFPAWIEINPRYSESNGRDLVRPVSVDACDRPDACEPALYTSHGSFELDSYGKSWRLWYADGRERPDGKADWERFDWES